jgi:AcrR family transcriptional regulator
MRVASTSASSRLKQVHGKQVHGKQVHRREPQQERAALRRAKLLAAAERLIGEVGYEAVTMTAIAEQAGASIGTLYDYFPDKTAIAVALKTQYVERGDAHWKELLSRAKEMTRDELAELFVEGALELVKELPAYLELMGAPVMYTRSSSLRRPLRKSVVGALQAMKPKLADERAYIYAEVIVQLIKGMLTVYREAAPRERVKVAEEFRRLFRLYLMETLG